MGGLDIGHTYAIGSICMSINITRYIGLQLLTHKLIQLEALITTFLKIHSFGTIAGFTH
jgi:hypothetical protein